MHLEHATADGVLVRGCRDYRVPDARVVVDHQDTGRCTQAGFPSPCLLTLAGPVGRLTTKTLPPSGGNSASSRPPWSSTIWRLMNNPRPRPERWLLACAWYKRS